LAFGDHAFAQFLSRGEEDRPVLRDFGLVAELFVGVGLELPGFGVAGVGEDQVMQDLHGPLVVPGGDRLASFYHVRLDNSTGARRQRSFEHPARRYTAHRGAAGGVMVWIGGPRRDPGDRLGRGRRGLYLHDPPPGYHPPRPRMTLKERQRRERQDWILEHVLAVILILSAAAVILIICLIIATHH
jgi:hypothetical protein